MPIHLFPVKLSLNRRIDSGRRLNIFKRRSNNNSKVKVMFNKAFYVTINKEYLFAQSVYFTTMMKPCYNDHNRKIFKLKIKVSSEAFRQAMQFLENGQISFDEVCFIEVCHLAVYLQIDSLEESCLDHFTRNLTRGSLESQLTLIRSHPFMGKQFTETLLKFESAGRDFFPGLYFISEEKSGVFLLKQIHVESRSVYNVGRLEFSRNSYKFELHQLGNSLVISISPRLRTMETFLIKVCLLTGKSTKIKAGNGVVDISVANKSLFLTREVETNGNQIAYSIEKTDEHSECFTSALSDFSPPESEATQVTIILSHSDGESLYYFFYYGSPSPFALDNVHVMEISIKTGSKTCKKLTGEYTKLKMGMTDEDFEQKPMLYFEKVLYIKESNVLLIEVRPKIVLVVHLSKSYYYDEDILPKLDLDPLGKTLVIPSKSLIYRFQTYGLLIGDSLMASSKFELKTFKFKKGKLKENEFHWEKNASCECTVYYCPCRTGYYPKLHSACLI